MKRIWLLAMLVLLGSSWAPAQNGGLQFSLKDLSKTLKGSTIVSSVAYGINDSGQVVGNYTSLTGGTYYQYCFLYTPGTKQAVTFTSSVSPTSCTGAAINAAGDIAGTIGVSGNLVNAYLRESSGRLKTYRSSFGGNSYGFGIDRLKNVVGEMDDTVNGDRQATTWSPTGHASLISPLAPSFHNSAPAVSPSGSFVAVNDADNSDSWIVPVNMPFFPRCGAWTNFDANTVVTAVNDSSHAVGGAWCDGDPDSHAMLWLDSSSTGWTDLGFPVSGAYAISSDDWVVGSTDAWNGSRGFLRVSDPNCPLMVDLDALLDSSGAGWTVVWGYGINSSHQIAALAVDPGGQVLHAVVLTPANNLPLCYPN